MRVYTHAEFLTLPAGVIYCKGTRWVFETPCVKGETEGNDCVSRDLCWIDSAVHGEDCFDRLDFMVRTGTSWPLETTGAWDSGDDAAVYLVYEPEDLLALQECIAAAFNVMLPAPVKGEAC